MSDNPSAEGSTPDVPNTETPEVQGGNPWLKMVPKDTAEQYSEVLNGFDSFNSFVQGSVESMNTLKEFKDKYDGATVVPGENATDEERKAFWAELRPSEASEYGVEEETLASLYHHANLTKEQANAITKGLVDFNENRTKEYEASKQENYKGALQALKEKHGDKLESVLATAQTAMSNLGGTELVGLLQEKGLDNDPDMIQFFINVGSLMQEGNIPIGHPARPKSQGLTGTYTTMEGIE